MLLVDGVGVAREGHHGDAAHDRHREASRVPGGKSVRMILQVRRALGQQSPSRSDEANWSPRGTKTGSATSTSEVGSK